MRKWIKWILLPVVVLAVIFGVEAICQQGVLTLPQQAVTAISLDDMQLSGGASEEEFFDEFAEEEYYAEEEFLEEEFFEEEETFEDELTEDVADEPAGPLTELYAPAGGSITIPVNGYVETLTLKGNISNENGRYTVSCTLPDSSVWTGDSFFWTMTTGENYDSVRIGRAVTDVTITFPDADVTLTGAEVDNVFRLNPWRMLLVGAIAAGLYLLIALRKVIGKRAEVGFLILALCVGVTLSVGMPANTGMSYDDEIHYNRIVGLTRGLDTWLTRAESTFVERGFSVLYNEAYHHVADTVQDQLRYVAMVNMAGEDMTPAVEDELQLLFSDAGYVIQSVGTKLAQLLGLPLIGQLMMARVFNMLAYVFLTYLGIRTLKRFKLTLAAIALMPTPMFLACSLTYDTTINALCFLGTALAVEAILDRETRLSWQRGLGILLCLMLGALSKVVYMPMLLLALLLPRSKFDSTGSRVWYKTFAVILCVLGVATMMLSVSEGSINLQDSRGDSANSAEQIAYLLYNPIAYLGTFFKTIWNDFEFYFLSSSRTYLGYSGMVTGPVAVISLLLIAFTIFTDNTPALNQKLNWKLRLGMFIIGMMAVGMTFTTMYVAYTGVGADYILGVQGRYLIPTLPLLAMVCSPEGLHNRMNKTGWHTTFYLINGVILTTVMVGLFSQYYL